MILDQINTIKTQSEAIVVYKKKEHQYELLDFEPKPIRTKAEMLKSYSSRNHFDL